MCEELLCRSFAEQAEVQGGLCIISHSVVAADLRIDVTQPMPVHDVAPAVFFFSLLHMHLVYGLCNPLTLSLQTSS